MGAALTREITKGTRLPRIILALALLLASGAASAAPMAYNFQYTFQNGEALAGMLTGELQADMDTILVSSVSMVAYSGKPGVTFEEYISDAATVTLSGTDVLLGAFGDEFLGDLQWAITSRPVGTPLPLPSLVYIPHQPPVLEIYRAAGWSLQAKTVALPGTLASCLLGLFLLVASRRLPARTGAPL